MDVVEMSCPSGTVSAVTTMTAAAVGVLGGVVLLLVEEVVLLEAIVLG